MRKRLLGLLLICCLFVSLVPAAYGAESRYYGFTDVKRGDWFAEPVAWAVENNITTGTSAATFSPNETCSRAQIITFLWRTAGSPRPRLIWAFRDVKVSSYYYTAALWADENGALRRLFRTFVACPFCEKPCVFACNALQSGYI